jgi:Domain of unknown function (DUF4189)
MGLKRWWLRRGCALLLTAGLIFAANAGYAQEEESQTQRDMRNCIMATGLAGCGTSHGPAPEARNDLWKAIAFAPSRNLAAFGGSFTAPENAKAAALKGCSEHATGCRVIAAVHDVCLAVAFERKAGGKYRTATGASKQDAEGKALTICVSEGPLGSAVLAGCSGQPPLLLVSAK